MTKEEIRRLLESKRSEIELKKQILPEGEADGVGIEGYACANTRYQVGTQEYLKLQKRLPATKNQRKWARAKGIVLPKDCSRHQAFAIMASRRKKK